MNDRVVADKLDSIFWILVAIWVAQLSSLFMSSCGVGR